MPHPLNLVDRHPSQLHKQRYGITSAICCQEVCKLIGVFLPCTLGFVIIVVRGLVHGKLLEFTAKLYCRFKGKGRTGGMTVEVCRPASSINKRLNILPFT